MIPQVNDDLQSDFEYQEEPTRTFKLNIDRNTITGHTDKLEAMRQAVYLILSVERYRHLIYSWNYGIELKDLYGKEMNFVLPELKRRISEALLQDSRITSVDNFDFQVNKNEVMATFNVATIFGDIEAERAVNV